MIVFLKNNHRCIITSTQEIEAVMVVGGDEE